MSPTSRTSSRRSVSALVAVAALALAACSGSSAATNPPASAAAASAASAAPSVAVLTATASTSAAPTDSGGAASNAPSASPLSGPTAVPTSIDPCQLIPAAEAGQLAGASFGAGREETLQGNGKMCVYGYQTKNVFGVIVAVAPDVATAKQEEAAAEAREQAQAAQVKQGLTVTKMPGFTSDSDAVLLELKPNSLGISGRAIYVLRGTVFFGFNDLVLGGNAPSADAMKAEAMTVLGRLP